MPTGIVRNYSKGRGTIAPDDGTSDVRVNKSAVASGIGFSLETGMPISFDVVADRFGRPMAVNVRMHRS